MTRPGSLICYVVMLWLNRVWICTSGKGMVTLLFLYYATHGLIPRFAYTDFGLARALDNRSLTDIPVILAYDCACSYSVNAHHRFEAHIPRHVDTITKMVFTIDSLHVHDHQDRCMYLYGTYYKDCIGHFTAVGTEQFWAENNQIASQARQMNPGHRHDKLTQSEADWNLKKVIRMGKRSYNHA